MRTSEHRTVVVFVKAPRPGAVKTRLTPFLSEEDAARLYRAFIQDTLAATSGLQGVLTSIAYTPADAQPFLQALLDGGPFDWFPQTGETLGARLWHAFQRAFQRGAERVVTIGSDSPTLPPSIITQAFEALITHDVVLGPATDGGYYLIGLTNLSPRAVSYPRLFEGIAWSTGIVLRQTLDAVQSAGLTSAELPRWPDIDQPDDLPRLFEEIEQLRQDGEMERAVQTERVLKSLKKWDKKVL